MTDDSQTAPLWWSNNKPQQASFKNEGKTKIKKQLLGASGGGFLLSDCHLAHQATG
jgi:hypothetical protein